MFLMAIIAYNYNWLEMSGIRSSESGNCAFPHRFVVFIAALKFIKWLIMLMFSPRDCHSASCNVSVV